MSRFHIIRCLCFAAIFCPFGTVLAVRPFQTGASLTEAFDEPTKAFDCAMPPCEADAVQDGKESPDQPTDEKVADVKEAPSSNTRALCLLIPLLMAAVSTMVPMYFHKKEVATVAPEDGNFELVETFHHLSYKDDALEGKWEKYAYIDNVRTGSVTLAVFASLMFCLHVKRGVFEKADNACYYWGGHVQWMFEVSFLFGFALASMQSLHLKSEKLYYSLVIVYAVYIAVTSDPPFRISCHTLIDKCANERPAGVASFDCSPQGISQMTHVITLILLLPLLIPKVNMLHYAWIGFMFYVAWTLTMRYSVDEGEGKFYYSPGFVACSLAILSFAILMTMTKKKQLELTRRTEFQFDLKRRETTEQMYGILAYMMPRHIVGDLILHPDTPIAIPVERVSILFIVIADFDNFTSKLGPKHLLEFLNQQFSDMDAICDANQVTKVETVGEEYVACVGVIPEDIEEARRAGHGQACLRLFKAAGQILALQTDEVQYKMGMHTGKIIAGVIGMKHLPRFRLFGDTINTSARLMQKGEKGKLQFGEETHKELSLDAINKCEAMREVQLKGKGAVKAWLFPKAGVAPADASFTKPQRKKGTPITEIVMTGTGSKMKKAANAIKALQRTQKALGGMSLSAITKAASSPEAAAQAGGSPTKAKELTDSQREQFEEIFDAMTKAPETMAQMSTDEEEKWEVEFHKQTFVKGLVARLNWQAFTLAVITGLEIIFLEATHAWETQYYLAFASEAVPGDWRIPLFITCRLLLFIQLMMWILASQVNSFVEEHPKAMQYFMMASVCFGGFCLLLSYDILTDRAVRLKRLHMFLYHYQGFEDTYNIGNMAPFNLNFKPLFMIVFYEMATTNVTHFWPFLIVAVLSCMAIGLFSHMEEADEGIEFMHAEAFDFFAMTMVLGAFQTWKRTRSTKARIHAQIGIKAYEKRIQGILNTLMPPLVVDRLREGLPSVHSYSKATIAQSDLCGFTQLSATKKPEEVVQFMSDLFGKFDELTDVFEVYKVETIGDAYIAGRAEEPLTKKSEPLAVLLFGLAMIKATEEWATNLGVKVHCRVGVHHGNCVGGIVGTEMQRYHLFGKLMVQLDTLEATSLEAVAQVSAACKKVIEEELEAAQGRITFSHTFEERTEEVLQTSKGEKHTYDEVDGKTFLVYPFGKLAND